MSAHSNVKPGPTNSSAMIRIGISTSSQWVHAVAINESGSVVATRSASRLGSLEAPLVAVLSELVDLFSPRLVSSVSFSTSWLDEQVRACAGQVKVGTLRIGLTSTGVPPFSGWPTDLAHQIDGVQATISGGADVDGSPLAELDMGAIDSFAQKCKTGVEAVAIAAVFSPLSVDHELLAGRRISEILGTIPVTLSHSVGGFGLLERENAAILNASLSYLGAELVAGVRSALDRVGVTSELFLAQNDGNLLSAEAASVMPMRVLDSRLATAVNGAAYLSSASEAIVLDFDENEPRAAVLQGGTVSLEADRSVLAGVRVIQSLPRGFALPRGIGSAKHLRHHARNAPLLGVGTNVNDLPDTDDVEIMLFPFPCGAFYEL